MQDQKIFTILQECTVSLTSPTGNGTGFFVAPGGWILTCDHMVADHTSVCLECITEGIKKTFTATVRLKLSDPIDIALLKIEGEAPAHKCVLLDHSLPLPGDRISIFGYPFSFGSMIYAEGDTVRTEYEGESFRNRVKILKLKAGQIQDGLSGSPLFNERTKKVCGILSTSRNTETDLGGRATPINLLFQSQYFQESSNDWNLLASILRENSNYHQKIDKSWSQFISRAYLDRKTALVVAAISVIVAIVVLAISPSNQVVMGVFRLIIACGFGYSVYLYIKSLNLDVVRSRRLPLSSLAGFVVTSSLLSLSLIAIPDRLIVLRNLTGINEYSVFGLIESNIPTPLKQTLDLKKEPIIDTQNPIYEAIQTFRESSGNTSLIKTYQQASTVSSDLNENNETVRIRARRNSLNQLIQKREKVYQDLAKYETSRGTFGGEGQEFYFTAGLMPLQTSLSDAEYTAFLPPLLSDDRYKAYQPGTLLQYPKLVDVKRFLTLHSVMPNKTWADIEWYRNILENNPDVRGFIGFTYKYIARLLPGSVSELLPYFGLCNFVGVERIAPSPYVRFMDIENKGSLSVNVSSVGLQTIIKDKYKLTPIFERDHLFQEVPSKDDPLNISIPPGVHLIIPIEFGFDTRSSKNIRRESMGFSGEKAYDQTHQKTNIENLAEKPIYLPSLPLISTRVNLPNATSDTTVKNVGKLLEPVKLSNKFVGRTRSLSNLAEAVPNRFAVGSMRNVVRIRIDGKDIQANSPLNDPRFSMSAYFAYGSCPYLLVYTSENGYWEELGTVITGQQSKDQENYGIYSLGDHPQKFRIEERDREVTYINSLVILYTDLKSGEEHELETKFPELASNDQSYYELHQNDVLEINLKSMLPRDAINVRLKVQGFYNILAGVHPGNLQLADVTTLRGNMHS